MEKFFSSLLIFLLFSAGIMLTWNWSLSPAFHLPEITFGTAASCRLLTECLFYGVSRK